MDVVVVPFSLVDQLPFSIVQSSVAMHLIKTPRPIINPVLRVEVDTLPVSHAIFHFSRVALTDGFSVDETTIILGKIGSLNLLAFWLSLVRIAILLVVVQNPRVVFQVQRNCIRVNQVLPQSDRLVK